jgi:hypothetical protein
MAVLNTSDKTNLSGEWVVPHLVQGPCLSIPRYASDDDLENAQLIGGGAAHTRDGSSKA